jgi:hypothetical protein
MIITAASECVMLLTLGSPAPGDDARRDRPRNKIEGTWEHTFKDNTELRQVKVTNQDHLVWVTYDLGSKAALATAGGSLTLDGDTYKEKVEFGRFGSPQLQETVGKEQTFNVNIDGDTLILERTLSNGMKLREAWMRVRLWLPRARGDSIPQPHRLGLENSRRGRFTGI